MSKITREIKKTKISDDVEKIETIVTIITEYIDINEIIIKTRVVKKVDTITPSFYGKYIHTFITNKKTIDIRPIFKVKSRVNHKSYSIPVNMSISNSSNLLNKFKIDKYKYIFIFILTILTINLRYKKYICKL
jgi:hypothetical protein